MSKSQYKRLHVQAVNDSFTNKVKFEVDLSEATMANIDMICKKLDIDYEGFMEFMVVFAKGSLTMYDKEE